MEHPGQDEAARRALCLGALVMRGKFESVAASATPQMHVVHEELATQLSIWIADEGLIAAQSTSEKLLIGKGLGSWSRQELIDVAWRANALGVILWSLSRFDELPPWDRQFTAQETIKPLNLFTPVENFIETAKLRPPAEIESARDLAELWHWRSRERRRQEEGDYSEMTSIAIERHYALNWLCGYAEDWDSVPTETRPGPGGA